MQKRLIWCVFFTNACLYYYQVKAKPKTSKVLYAHRGSFIFEIRHLGSSPKSNEDWSQHRL